MPPILTWFRGATDICRNQELYCSARPGDVDMIPVEANGQPAFAVYQLGQPVAIQVVTPTKAGIQHIVSFGDPALFPLFGLTTSIA